MIMGERVNLKQGFTDEFPFHVFFWKHNYQGFEMIANLFKLMFKGYL